MNSNGDDKETQAIPPVPPKPSQTNKPSLPPNPKNSEETQVISPVEETRMMPPARPSGDDATTKVGINPANRGSNSEETQVISASSPSKEEENPAETTMYLGAVGGGDDYDKVETKATPEDFGYVDYDNDLSYDDSGTGTYDFSDAFPASTQAPFTPPPSTPGIYGQEAAYQSPKKKKKKEKEKRGKGGWIALIVILAVLICLGFGGWWWWSTNRRQRALETCQQIQTQLTNASDNARQVIASAQSELDSAVYSQGGSSLVSALQSDIDTTLPVAVSCPVSASAALLNSNAQSMNQAVEQINSLISKTQSDIQALKSSQATAALKNAKASLSKAIAAAQQALAQNNGAVADPATISALQKALTQAKNVEQDSSSTVSQMSTAQTALQEAVEKVTASAQKYEQQKLESLKQQQQKEMQQESKAASPSPSSSPSMPLEGSGANSYNRTMAGPSHGNLEGPGSGSSASSSSSTLSPSSPSLPSSTPSSVPSQK
ncbi:MAG: hypothetical protein IIY27_02330 [Aeriscardovia sp.]|nr:hypothetical protein [Aeriscardovia sp.]